MPATRMPATRAPRAVRIVLRCYPRLWRQRHGGEAAELAALLMRDGVPAHSIAWSYLHSAARERLTPRPGRRLAAAATVLLTAAGLTGAPVALLSATAPASAASATRAHARDQAHPAVHLRSRLDCGAPLGEAASGAGPAGLPSADGHDQRC
ncbi:MAG TPA: hypothetical protein VIF35_16890 [Streptosporangiaceae bacterium]|jgi:hypothetical protein